MVSLMCVCVAELCFVCCVFVMCALESFGAGASIVPAAEVPAGWWAFDMWMCVVVLEYVCLLVPVNYQRRYSLGNGGPFDVCVYMCVCVFVQYWELLTGLLVVAAPCFTTSKYVQLHTPHCCTQSRQDPFRTDYGLKHSCFAHKRTSPPPLPHPLMSCATQRSLTCW